MNYCYIIHMDSNYRANVGKWLPQATVSFERFFMDLLVLGETMFHLAHRIAALLQNASKTDFYDQTDLESLTQQLEQAIVKYRAISKIFTIQNIILKYKIKHLTFTLKKNLNIVARFTKYLMNEIVYCMTNEYLSIVFRLVNVYNELLSLVYDVSDQSINIFYNDSPTMLELLNKFSITRILQILAKNRAEEYCHEFIDCLLAHYRSNCDNNDIRFTTSNDIDISENSSIEIYRTLTKHLLTPIVKSTAVQDISLHVETMKTLVDIKNEQIIKLLKVVKNISPYLLGSDTTKIENDEMKIRRVAVKKITQFYQEVAWGSVSSILDHIVLWWSSEALAARHSHGSQYLKNWLQQFIQGNNVPSSVRLVLQTLCDALGCHVTITVWDHFFRLAYIIAFQCQSKISSEAFEGTDTGQKFVKVFQILMILSNECEMGGEWVMGTPLTELPLSEQIIILHRMDHSVHIMRLWAMQEARMIAHTWDLEIFFLLVKGDIVSCVDVLSYLKLADHTNELKEETISVHVYACTKMRAKIISEVTTNIQLLKHAPALCIKMLMKIGQIISSTNLHMCFPKSNYWKKSSTIAPSAPSFYVKIYFQRVLFPVLEVIEDSETSNMILRIMCETWLDYIYLCKIKFSEWGALQLLTDFAYVLTWISDCPKISEEVRQKLLKNEVLRRCEGVGRLLLRYPGEAISMNKKFPKKTTENGSLESLGFERMPAEMYVPNQKQWLELRGVKWYNFCCP